MDKHLKKGRVPHSSVLDVTEWWAPGQRSGGQTTLGFVGTIVQGLTLLP